MPLRDRATLLRGTLDLLILEALATGELHGLGVSIWDRTALAMARALEA